MPISVDCLCGNRFRVADQHAGKKGKCPACGKAVLVPLDAAPGASQVTGKKVAPAVPESIPNRELPEETREAALASLPGWCRAFLKFDILWSWLVLALAIVAMVVVDRSRTGVIVRDKDWPAIGLFVALLKSIANLRLLRRHKSSIWFGVAALSLTLIEQWVRADENTHPRWLYALLIVGSLAYDGLYIFAVLRVRQAIKSESLGKSLA